MSDIFFDFSATFNGDGTTAAQAASNGATGAYNTTDGVTPVERDIWWIRRSGTERTITTTITPVNHFSICGWPMSGDENYADRPASGTSNGWDADTDEYGQIYKTYNILVYTLITSMLEGFYTSRMWYRNLSSTTGVDMDGDITGAKYTKCKFMNELASTRACAIGGTGIHVSDCIITGGTGNIAFAEFSIDNGIVTNCQISFGVNASYCTNTIFSNIDIIANINAGLYDALNITGTNNCTFENITIDSSIYTGTVYPGLLVGNAATVNSIVNVKFKGNYIDIDFYGTSMNYTITPLLSGDTINVTNTVSFLNNNNSIVLENVTAASLNFSTADSIIFLKNCTIPDVNITTTNLQRSAVYSLNHGGVTGYWKAFGHQGYIESSDVYRTGGSAKSLRCERTVEIAGGFEDQFPLLGMRNKGEVIYLDLTAGTHTATVYGAHRIFANPLTRSDLFLEVEYVDSNGSRVSISTIRNGSLETDTSTWNGDTDLTVFKMVITFTIPTDQQVPLRILGAISFENSAYFYIDPIPVLT